MSQISNHTENEEEDDNFYISNTYLNETVNYGDANADNEEDDEVRKRQSTYDSFFQTDYQDEEDHEPETEEQIKERQEKQKYLKAQILDYQYLPSAFEVFLEDKKENGANIGAYFYLYSTNFMGLLIGK